MSDLRIQVLEFLGWEPIFNGASVAFRHNGSIRAFDKLTLDLMHEAEARLTDEQHARFRKLLVETVKKGSVLSDYTKRAYVSATAEQRATALLRAVKEKGTP